MRANEQGFTLLEAVVATAILAIGIFSLYSMQVMSVRGNNIASTVTRASNLDALHLERLLAAKFDKKPGEESPGLLVDKNHKDFRDECWLWNKEPAIAAEHAEKCLDANSTYEKAKDALKAGNVYVFETDDKNFLIAYNVAAHYPVIGVKTVRVHVFSHFRSNRDSGLKPTTFELIRNDPNRSPESGPNQTYY